MNFNTIIPAENAKSCNLVALPDRELIAKMRWVFEPLPLRAMLIHSLVPFLQPDLHEMNFASFPTLALVGKPGSGKTPTAKAILRKSESLYMFATHKNFVESLSELKGECALLDDFFDPNAESGKQRIKSNFDEAVRLSYDGTGPLTLITMESGAVKLLNQSGRERIIPVFFGKGLSEPDTSERVKYLQRNKSLDELIALFDKNYSAFLPDDIPALLDDFRARNREIAAGPKRTDMVFCIDLTARILNEIVFEAYGENLFSTEEIDRLTKFLLKCDFGEHVQKPNMVEKVLERFLLKSVRPIAPVPKDVCRTFVSTGCSDFKFGYGVFCQNNNCTRDDRMVSAYDPTELVLDYNCDFNAVLISQPDYIWQYQRPYSTPPFLVMDARIFLAGMNAELERLSMETGEKVFYFSGQKLHQELARLNRCAVFPNGKTFRYSLSYPGSNGDEAFLDARVVILLLKQEEFQHLQAISENPSFSLWLRHTAYSPEITRILRNTFSSLLIRTGEVGVETKQE
ncbi:MAG: hypothetical protein ACI4JC_07640 [Faecalibacterium sp.]